MAKTYFSVKISKSLTRSQTRMPLLSAYSEHHIKQKLTADNCQSLWLTADNCQSLWLTADKCQSLWLTADKCQSLWLTADNCQPLWLTADNCQSLWLTADNCQSLWLTADKCQSFWLTADKRQSLWLTANKCASISQSVETATWCKTFKLQLRQLAARHTLKMTAGACASEHAVTQLRFCCMSWTRLWHLMTLAFRRWIYILLFTYLLHVKMTIFRFNCSSQPQL